MEETIYQTLKNADCNPYWPGQYQGPCKECYVLINGPSTSSTNKSAATSLLDLIIFTPRPQLDDGQFVSIAEILNFKQQVIEAMKQLPYRYADDTPIIVDGESMAFTSSVRYQIYKRR